MRPDHLNINYPSPRVDHRLNLGSIHMICGFSSCQLCGSLRFKALQWEDLWVYKLLSKNWRTSRIFLRMFVRNPTSVISRMKGFHPVYMKSTKKMFFQYLRFNAQKSSSLSSRASPSSSLFCWYSYPHHQHIYLQSSLCSKRYGPVWIFDNLDDVCWGT